MLRKTKQKDKKASFSPDLANPSKAARNMGTEKRTLRTISVFGLPEGNEVITIRVYGPQHPKTGAEKVFASLWIHHHQEGSEILRTSGHGSADGYGYCKHSAAIAAALENAGVVLIDSKLKTPWDIAGRGMDEVMNAVLAIMHAAGYSSAIYCSNQ